MSLMRNSSQLLFSLKYYFSDCHHFSQTIILAETQISRKLLFLCMQSQTFSIRQVTKIKKKEISAQYSLMYDILELGGWASD